MTDYGIFLFFENYKKVENHMERILYDGGKILYELGILLATDENRMKNIKEMHKKYRKLG